MGATNRPARRAVAQIAALALVLATAGLFVPASAAKPTKQFGCKVTALRIGATELAVANEPYNPCVDSTGNVENLPPTAVDVYVVSATALLAATDVEPRSSEAAASALDLKIVAPGVATVEAGQALFRTKSECVENKQGKPTAQHPKQTATATGITITTATGTVNLDREIAAGEHKDVPIPGVGTAHVFHESLNDTRPGHKTDEVTIALLFVDFTNPSLPDITLLETKTDFSGQPCAPGQTT